MRKLKSAIFAIICLILVENFLFSTIYCRVEGFVKDKDTGKGIPNVKVILVHSMIEMYKVKTDANGYFAFKKVDPGADYFIACEEDNYVTNPPGYMQENLYSLLNNPKFREIAGFFTLKEGDSKSFIINLEKGGKIKGKIFQKDANGIKHMINCMVYLEKEYEETDLVIPSPYLPIPKSITIDNFFIMDNAEFYSMKNGEFCFNGLRPSDKYSLNIQSKKGFAYQFIKVAEVFKDDTVFIDFTFDFEDQTGVKGKVTKDGSTINFRVYIDLYELPDENSAADTKADAEGNYSIRMVKPGLYRLDCTYFDSDNITHEKKIVVRIEENEIKIVNFKF
jgi:hypothetical protein